MRKKILENLSFVVITLVLILIAVFSKNGTATIYIAGGGMMVYGILALLLKNRYSSLILGGGISLLSTMFFYSNEILDKIDSLTFFIAFSMILICIISYAFMFITEKEINSKYDMDVEAEVIDLEKNPNTKKEYYRPIYAYYLDNGEYKVGLPYFLNKIYVGKYIA